MFIDIESTHWLANIFHYKQLWMILFLTDLMMHFNDSPTSFSLTAVERTCWSWCPRGSVFTYVSFDNVRPLLACGRTIKFHFCWANVFELAIKQRFSPPSQRTTRPRRGVGPFSFFVYSPTNWFCSIHRPFSPLLSSSLVALFLRSLIPSQGDPKLFRGTQIHLVCVRGVRTSVRGRQYNYHWQKLNVVQNF